MTSRCDPALRVHTTTKTLEDLMLHNYLTLAHHGAFLVIDAIDPAGTINPAVYERIGQVFAASIPYEPFLTGSLVSEAALVMSYDSKFSAAALPADHDAAERSHPQLKAQLGMASLMQAMRLTYTVLPGNRLDRLSGKKLALLTDAPRLRPEQIDQLERYVADGGSLYLSGATDERLVERLLGLRRVGLSRETSTYVAPTQDGQRFFAPEYSARYPLSFEGRQVLVENRRQQQVLATITLPYTDPADPATFASIHSNPPGRATEYPAIVLGRYGQGRVLWLSCPLETQPQEPIRAVVRQLLEQLARPEIVDSDAPACVELTLFEDDNRHILHCVNVQASHPIWPVAPFTVRLKLDRSPHRVRRAPDLTDVPFSMADGAICFQTAELRLFDTYLID
jgi:hypothetical protein